MQSIVLLAGFAVLWIAIHQVQLNTGRHYGPWSNLYSWYLPLWVVQAVLLLFPIYTWGYKTSWWAIEWILLCHGGLVIGQATMMIYRGAPRRLPAVLSDLDGSRRFFTILMIVGLVCQFILSANSVLGSGVSVAERFDSEGMAEVRTSNFEGNAYGLGALFGVFATLSTCIWLSLPYFTYYLGLKRPWTRRLGIEPLLAFSGLMLIIMDALVVRGGRLGIVLILSLSSIAWALGRWVLRRTNRAAAMNAKPRTPLRSLAAAGLIILATFASAEFQAFRGGSLDPEAQLSVAYDASVAPDLRQFTGRSRYWSYYMVQTIYLCSSINILSVYTDLPQMPGPYMGQYNFAPIYRNIGRFLPGYDVTFWEKDRAEIFGILESKGRYGNVWATQLRDFASDFGSIGAIFFMFVLGLVAQWATDLFYREPNGYRAGLLAFFRLLFLFSGFHSLLFFASVEWPFLAYYVIVMAGWGSWNRMRRRAGPMPPPPGTMAPSGQA